MTYSYQTGVHKDRTATFIIALFVAVTLAFSALISFTTDAKADKSGTVVPGHAKSSDVDGNDSPDAGVWVNGHYTALYAYDASGAYYWDLGDGRVQGTVGSVAELDQATLTTCDYVINYRADFGNDPYMDKGSIHNNIKCSGVEKGTYNSVIVSSDDPRYTGNPDLAEWGTWEYVVNTTSGVGNVANPMKHQD